MGSDIETTSRICRVPPGTETDLNRLLKPRTIFMASSLALILITAGLVYYWMLPPPFVPPTPQPPIPTPLQLTPHGAIAIDGDANFEATALLEGWPGDGSPENPFIIDGLDIEQPYASCISISNTRVNFVISNCNLTGAWEGNPMYRGAGIYLENVTNGEIVNNICKANREGILLFNSTYNVVANNTSNSNDVGIYLEDSNSNIVSDNTCTSGWCGISVRVSDSNVVSDNTCNNNAYSGIRLGESQYNTLTNNICNSNTYGIYLDDESDSNNIENNTCLGNTEHDIFGEFVAREFLWFLVRGGMLLVASVIAFAILRRMKASFVIGAIGGFIIATIPWSDIVYMPSSLGWTWDGVRRFDVPLWQILILATILISIGFFGLWRESGSVIPLVSAICIIVWGITAPLLRDFQPFRWLALPPIAWYFMGVGWITAGISAWWIRKELRPFSVVAALVFLAFGAVNFLVFSSASGDWNIWNSIFFAATGIVTGIYFLDAVRTPMSATTESPSEPLIALWRLKCPHCAAVYAYDEQEGTEPGFVRCQNCYREFGPTADKQTSQASPEEDVQ